METEIKRRCDRSRVRTLSKPAAVPVTLGTLIIPGRRYDPANRSGLRGGRFSEIKKAIREGG
jgi:hypothetical protein